MRVQFYKKEMDKNIEFTRKIYSMTDLVGYKIFFEEFLEEQWKRVPDEKMNIERFLKLMDGAKFFVSNLQMGEDEHIPIRYTVNVKKGKEDKLFEMNADYTIDNFSRIYLAYSEIYGRNF